MKKVTWQSPSNIALIKYWGKRPVQLPMNPSISFTLNKASTTTSVVYRKVDSKSKSGISFLFEGKPMPDFERKINGFIQRITTFIPILDQLQLSIESSNSFPHSSGIASSASAMSALALCLVSIELELTGEMKQFENFYQKSSFIARIGSGSASRSVYGGHVIWGKTNDWPGSSDEYSIPINEHIHSIFGTYKNAILLVTDKSKKVSSSVGHSLMNNHPYSKAKFEQSVKNTQRMLEILKTGEQMDYALLTETEAFHLHAMMMTSTPEYLLMEPPTVAIINKIRDFRQTTKIPVCFTLDAGANVHFIYPENEIKKITPFIKQQLLPLTVNNTWLDDNVGNGPVKLS